LSIKPRTQFKKEKLNRTWNIKTVSFLPNYVITSKACSLINEQI
jgi:hypothetical protein